MSASRPIRPLAAGLLGVALGVLATTAWGVLSRPGDLRAFERLEESDASTSLAGSLQPSPAESTGLDLPPGHPACPWAHATSSPREAGSPPRCPALGDRSRHLLGRFDPSPSPAQPGIVPGSIGEAARAATVL